MPVGASWGASGEPTGGSFETYWGSLGGLVWASGSLKAISGVSLGRMARNLNLSFLSLSLSLFLSFSLLGPSTVEAPVGPYWAPLEPS